MITHRTATTALSLVLVAGSCGAPATAWIPFDGARSERSTYAGTSRNDFWAADGLGKLEHFDGTTWLEVPAGEVPYSGSMLALGADDLLFAAGPKLFVVTPAGIDRMLETPPGTESMTLKTGFGVTLVSVTVANFSRPYRLQGDALTPFGPDFERPLRVASILGPDDVWAYTDEPTELASLVTEQGVFPTGLAHFDGTHWRALGSSFRQKQLPLRTSSHIPASAHVVLGSFFDGGRLRPLGLGHPRDGYLYWSPAGRLGQVVRFSGSASSPNVYRPVDLGGGQTGYEQVDVNGEVAVNFVSLEWTGRAWENPRQIGAATQCSGVYCSGDMAGVVGELLDGTILIAAPTEEGPGLYVFTP